MAVAQYCSVYRFIKHHGLVHQMGTHILKWDPRELEDIATAFMAKVHPIVNGAGRDQDYIFNLDQSPIWTLVGFGKMQRRLR